MKNCPLGRIVVAGLILALTGVVANAQVSYDDDAEQLIGMATHLTSPVVLQALDLEDRQLSAAQAADRLKYACLLLEAAAELAPYHLQLWHDALSLYITDAIDDPGRAQQAHVYCARLASLHYLLHRNWLGYQYNKFNTQEDRGKFLDQMRVEYASYPSLSSIILTRYAEIQTQVGQFASDPDNQIVGATQLFDKSVQLYRYNTAAISGLLATPADQTTLNYPLLEALLFRQQLQNNPFRLDGLLNLIRHLDDEGLFSLAQLYYPPAYRFLEWMEDDTGLTHELRLNQLFSLYSGGQYAEAMRLCDVLLRSDPANLVALSLKAKCYEKRGNEDRYAAALQRSEKTADLLWRQWQTAKDPQTQIWLGWYYCLVSPNPERASEVTDLGAGAEANQEMVNYRCYASLLNSDTEQTEALLADADAGDPIVALVGAKLDKAQNNIEAALARLNAIQRYPKGLVADEIRREYEQLTAGLEESEETSTFAALDNEALRNAAEQLFQRNFDNRDFEIPYDPLKYLQCSVQMVSGKDTFGYNDPILANIYLTNNGNTPIILGPENITNPIILLLAEIEPLDRIASSFTKPIPPETTTRGKMHVLAHWPLYEKQVLSPSESNMITRSLNIGVVRDLLQSYPQKSFRLTYRILVDPLVDNEGAYVGNISQIQPKPFTLWRKAFKLSAQNMKRLYEMSRSDEPDDRIEAVQTLGGLLRESALAEKGQARYRVRPLKNRDLLRSWIAENLTSEDFRVQAWSAFALRGLPVSARSGELQNLTGLLNSPHAFVRFMVVQTLQSSVDLQDYYEWALANDESDLIQRLVMWKTGQSWPRNSSPYDQLIEESQPPGASDEAEADADAASL